MAFSDDISRLERAAALGATQPSKRMLVIANPYATTMSDRLRHLVVYALQGRYQVQALDTQRKNHATEICREAADEGYDVVVAFGGDGTVNEVANGLAGSDTPLIPLPGGATNVYCRMLGIPNDVVDATEHLLGLADDWRPRAVDLGVVNGRLFTFAAGAGLDASVVERVDSNPELKARYGPLYYASAATGVFLRRYLLRPPRLDAAVDGADAVTGTSIFVQNGNPYTYFRDRPIKLVDGQRLDSGHLGGAVLQRASALDMPTVTRRILSANAEVSDHRRVTGFSGAREIVVRSLDERPLPLQVDGDYVGTAEQATFSIRPRSLRVVA